ncbi:MAG: chromate transporter [Treponema sp.]|nr:chromate transporter [Treponema sp.]
MKDYLELLLTFAKMGCITFGGGYAMIPIVDRELIKKKGWVTMDEVMDYYTIAQITPGIIAVNLSTFVGYKRKGPLGGTLTTIGFVLPGICFILLVAYFLRNIMDYPAVVHAFAGIRIAVGALILDTVVKMVKGIFKEWKSLIIYVAAFILSAAWSVSPMLIILGAGVIGLAVYLPATLNKTGKGGSL